MGMQVARVKNTFPRNIHDKLAAGETGARKTLEPDKWREDGTGFLGDNMFFQWRNHRSENKSPPAVTRNGASTVIDESMSRNFT